MKQRQHARGFTLIELLVVISIIALLVAILLPSLAAARDSARSTLCLSNLRQIGVAYAGYANEFRDYMPGSCLYNNSPVPIDPSVDIPPGFPGSWSGPRYSDWTARLGQGGYAGPSVSYTAYNGGVTYAGAISWQIFRDPGEPLTYEGVGDPSPSGLMNAGGPGIHVNRWTCYSMRNSYSVNFEITKYYYGAVRRGFSVGPQYAKISDAALVVDGEPYYTFFLDEMDYDESYWAWARILYAYRHNSNKATNVLYWDGHAVPRRHHWENNGQKIWVPLFDPSPGGGPWLP